MKTLTSLTLGLLLCCLVFAGCSGSGVNPIGDLVVGNLVGSDKMGEMSTQYYYVNAAGDVGITYQWTCIPDGAGEFSKPTKAQTAFTASDVTGNQTIKIQVVVESANDGPVVVKKSIFVVDGEIAGDFDSLETFFSTYPDAYIKSPNGTFLGKLNANTTDAGSIANKSGDYGDKASALSIWNPFGTYGSALSAFSPWGFMADSPPVVYNGTTEIATLTISTNFSPRMNPYVIEDYLGMG